MKKRKKASCKRSQKTFFITALLVYLLSASLSAQQSVNTSGGNLEGDGEVSYSIGQLVYNVNSSSAGSESQGVQVVLLVEEEEETGTEEASVVDLRVYPNPTADLVTIHFDNQPFNSGYVFKLYSIAGELMIEGEMDSSDYTVDMTQYNTGTYILKLSSGETELKTYKIIKN